MNAQLVPQIHLLAVPQADNNPADDMPMEMHRM